MSEPHRVYAYIDETGDRGNSAKSSPIFGMAAVLVDELGTAQLRGAVSQLRSDFSVPTGTVLSWKAHAKTHERRLRAADVLGSLSNVKVCYVYAQKSELQPGSYLDDRTRFYNYIAYKTYKSILWGARAWKGGDAEVRTRFGHVQHHDNSTTDTYIRREAANDTKVPFHMEKGLRWVSADKYEESQAADLYGGFLRAATWPGDFGYVEPAYLLKVWHQIRNSGTCAIPLGMMSMPSYDVVTSKYWFPCTSCPRQTTPAP